VLPMLPTATISAPHIVDSESAPITDVRRMPDERASTEPAPRDGAPADGAGSGSRAELIAQLARLEHELRLRDEFISTAAHELRNPLSPAYMQLEHLKEIARSASEPIEPAWLAGQLTSITARFDRFLDTLNRILDASRLGEGHLALLPEACDLIEVITSVLAAAELELRASQTPVQLAAPAAVVGWWDRMRLEQIVSNLVSNAARYGAGRPISVEVTATAGAARVIVQDHGIGISPADLPRIFHRFERARNVGRNSGFGIGLWIVSQLCRAMGGSIEVESEVGRGSTFQIELPRTSAS
jgi:signal transduction histidine kinase